MSRTVLSEREKTRMLQWLVLSLLAYGLAALLAAVPGPTDAGQVPRVQAVLWKVGHLNLAAYIGFWVDKHAFRDRIDPDTNALFHIRRAIVIAAAMIGFGLAL
jgi:hypothetical protein